jgi:hypothetical protein
MHPGAEDSVRSRNFVPNMGGPESEVRKVGLVQLELRGQQILQASNL